MTGTGIWRRHQGTKAAKQPLWAAHCLSYAQSLVTPGPFYPFEHFIFYIKVKFNYIGQDVVEDESTGL